VRHVNPNMIPSVLEGIMDGERDAGHLSPTDLENRFQFIDGKLLNLEEEFRAAQNRDLPFVFEAFAKAKAIAYYQGDRVICTYCGQDKPGDQFYWRGNRCRVGEGCKPCYLARTRNANRDMPRNSAATTARNEASRAAAGHAQRPWTSIDDQVLIMYYDDPNVSLERLAAELGRTIRALNNRAMVLRRRSAALTDRRTATTKHRPVTT
jgi:hypothetical protein